MRYRVSRRLINSWDLTYNTSHVLSSSQWQLSASGMVPPTSKTTPATTAPIQVTQHFNNLDANSFLDRGSDMADALIPVLQGTHRIGTEIQRVVNPGQGPS
jgi:hypothetical protein